jgi:hypothetical protein
MFDFSNLTREQINHLVLGFEKLAEVPEVKAFEWGIEKNAEDSPLGFTHSFMLTFDSFQTRTDYLNSLAHREYEQEVMKFRNKVLVFDYEVKKVL